MFLKLSPNFFKKISFRLTFGFIILFSISSLTILLLNYLLFSQSLKSRDHENLYAKAKEYSSIYSKENLEEFKKYLAEQKQSDADSQYLVRIEKSNRETIFIHIPEEMKRWTENELNQKLSVLDPSKKIDQFSIKERSDDDPNEENTYEITTIHGASGYNMQIARNTDERDDLLERYLETILILSIVILIIAAAGGFIFSNQALNPLRNLIEAIKRIRSGHLSARVPVLQSNDEFEEISFLFNNMAERIESLILNMQQTLDTVAHELRTPLTRLKSKTELALLSPPSDEKYKEALVNTIENTNQIVSLINTIMDISEVEAGVLKLNLIKSDSEKILTEIIDFYSMVAEQKNIKIQFKQNVKFNFLADRIRFRQVISNLIDNAIKYSPEHTEIIISTNEIQDDYQISISDQGMGISEQDLSKIWDRLFRTNPHHAEKGLGLGLSLVRSICRAHQWSIEVQSTINQGSLFILNIKKSSD